MDWDFLKEPGMIAVIITIAIFYGRIMFLRQQLKNKQMAKPDKPKRISKSSKPADEGKKPAVSEEFLNPKYQITNWTLGGPGIILMLVGVVSRTSDWLPAAFTPYWYIPSALGVLLLTFSINTK